MEDFNRQKDNQKKVPFQELSSDDKQKLVGAFAWLIQEDKKQNPALYQIVKKT